MTGDNRHLKNERGSVVLMAVFLVFFISILMITVELIRLADTEALSNHIEDMQTYYCAEAGIEFQIRSIRNANTNPQTRAFGVGCPSTTISLDCTNGKGTVDTGWKYKLQDKSDKADPNYTYCNYDYMTGIGCKGSFVSGNCSGQFSSSVRALVKRTNQSSNLRLIQIIRWREL
jgi:hypothetical protein